MKSLKIDALEREMLERRRMGAVTGGAEFCKLCACRATERNDMTSSRNIPLSTVPPPKCVCLCNGVDDSLLDNGLVNTSLKY